MIATHSQHGITQSGAATSLASMAPGFPRAGSTDGGDGYWMRFTLLELPSKPIRGAMRLLWFANGLAEKGVVGNVSLARAGD